MKKLMTIALTLIMSVQIFAETVPTSEKRGVKCMVTAEVNGAEDEVILKRKYLLDSSMNTARAFQFSSDEPSSRETLYWATLNYNYQTNALCIILEAPSGKVKMYCENGSIIVHLNRFDDSARNDRKIVCQYHGSNMARGWDGWPIDPIF